MKLQTKLMLGFSVVLFMVLTLGGTSYYLTETMSHFSGQAGYIENGKTALLNTQTAYLRFIVYGDDSFAQRSLEQLAEAKKQLDLCLPMIVNPRKQTENDGLHQWSGSNSAAFAAINQRPERKHPPASE